MNNSSTQPNAARGSRRRALVASVVLLLSSCLSSPLRAYDLADFYISCFDPIGTSNPDWMSYLPDDILLTELSIPATHDTMTYGYTGAIPIPDNVVDQGVTLADQLGAGVRLIDIRCHYDTDSEGNYLFNIAHGVWPPTGTPNRAIYVNATLTDVLRTVNRFLGAHPAETVMMNVQQEAGSVGPAHTGQDFAGLFQTYLDGADGLRFWRGDAADGFRKWPRLGAVRGKIVLLQRFESDTPFGIDVGKASFWDGDEAEEVKTLGDIPDRWFGSDSEPDKGLRDHLLETINSCSRPGVMYTTSPTGYGPSGTPLPYTISGGVTNGRCGSSKTEKGLNEYTLEFLRNEDVGTGGYANQGGHWRTGVIWMDFPGGLLIESIILHNPFVFVDGSYAAVYSFLGSVPYPVGYGRNPASTVGQAVAAVTAANAVNPCVPRFSVYIDAGMYNENVRFDQPMRLVSRGGAARIGTP